MNAGIILVAVYWAIFTVKRHFTPRLTAATKAIICIIGNRRTMNA